ncbi:MAG: hypothetical protein ABIK09_12615 [Pseudomonadota bacterium]
MRTSHHLSRSFIVAVLLGCAAGCLDTSVDFTVEPLPGEDVPDTAAPDAADGIGGETAADLFNDTPDPTDTPELLDTPDTQDTTDDAGDVTDPVLQDTVDPVDTVDTVEPLDGDDLQDAVDPDTICTPDCDGKICGDDGCGGDCGACDELLVCEAGQCIPLGDSLSCEGRCGETGANCDCDDGCFAAGSCCGDICVAFCTDLPGCTCGNGACEGFETCETCPADCGCLDGALCLGGMCCTPDCAGKTCGGDGCSGTCGSCTGDQDACVAGLCACQPGCDGLECGADGCGGSCGACDDVVSCTDDACDGGLCVSPIGPYFCLIDGLCVISGAENLVNPCEKCKPATDQEAWTPREDGVPCGATATCWQGACCDGVANCAGKDCGDDGCGWVCGVCDPSETCGADGLCACGVESLPCGGACCESGQVCHVGACCFPACGGKNCGSDGCGGDCGICAGLQDLCLVGLCVCQPDCDGKDCGPDGCGGACGACTGQDACADGACVCQPDCGGKNCGPDGCGGSCGACEINEACTEEGFCECAAGGAACGGGCCVPLEICHGDACCAPDCTGKDCGDDGCGSLCGACTGQDACESGLCICQPLCAGKECGPDGCGGDCGVCTGQDACLGGACICQPACDGKDCGPDGCGGSCGACDDGLSCTADACLGGLCVATIGPFFCLLDGTCVPSGTENPLNPCEACKPATAQEAWTVLEDGTSCGVGDVCFQGGCCAAAANCTGKECGDDGCGGDCGDCAGTQALCVDGFCVCQPDCDGKSCGGDGCVGTCGDCGLHEVCAPAFTCVCVPDSVSCDGTCCAPSIQVCADGACCTPACAGKDCGADGCGSTCGACDPDQVCIGDLCPPPGDQCDDFNATPWDGCTDGQLTEFQGNATATSDQLDPDVAVNAQGQFLVVWESKNQDGDDFGVFGRLFGPDGTPVAPELQINVHAADIQMDPRAAALSDDRFVVTWVSKNQAPDGSGYGVFARFVGADGAADGGSFAVNFFHEGDQLAPVPAATDAGFLVVWHGEGNSDDDGIWCRAFSLDGAVLSSQQRVNSETDDQQRSATLAPLGGGAVAAWASKDQDGNGWGIFGQRLTNTCSKSGSEFQVNASGAGNQDFPTATSLSSGAFLVTWSGNVDNGVDGSGVGARRFSGAGQALGGDVLVNTTLGSDQQFPYAVPAGSGYVVAWQSNGQDGNSKGVFFQRLTSIGVHTGGEFQANVQWNQEQQDPACAGFSDGSFVLAWESHDNQDGDGWGIFVRRFDATGEPLYL